MNNKIFYCLICITCFLLSAPDIGNAKKVEYISGGTFVWNDMKILVPKDMKAVILDDSRLTIYAKYNNEYIALDFGKYTDDNKNYNVINHMKSRKDCIVEESRSFDFKGYPAYNIAFLIPQRNEYGYYMYIKKIFISIIYLDDKGGFSLFKPIIDNITFVSEGNTNPGR
jgi:hypothetical protein